MITDNLLTRRSHGAAHAHSEPTILLEKLQPIFLKSVEQKPDAIGGYQRGIIKTNNAALQADPAPVLRAMAPCVPENSANSLRCIPRNQSSPFWIH
jgi:hypothetical protein